MQKAGREQRSTVNNVIIISLIIQKRKSERFNTYLFHVDAVKCFGELWLKDSIVELNIIGSKKWPENTLSDEQKSWSYY